MEELTDLVLDIISHTGHFVEESERLVHALLNNAQVGQHLLNISNMMFFLCFPEKKTKTKNIQLKEQEAQNQHFTLKTIKKSNHFSACLMLPEV